MELAFSRSPESTLDARPVGYKTIRISDLLLMQLQVSG